MENREPLTESAAREALSEVLYPGLKRDIVSFGILRSVTVRNGRVHVSLVLSSQSEEVQDQLRASIRERLSVAGAVRTEVQIVPPERRPPGVPDPWADRARVAGVKKLIAVGSGKGGVGKSTVAANLAISLHARGYRVGILDADIYGPSIPMILGIDEGATRVRMTDDRKIIPLEVLGVFVVSFGFFLGPQSPAVWRGPMVSKAVKQFSRGVVWPDLDVLVVDLPPGTGDVPLSLAQAAAVDGAIVVTTPQRLAVQEAEKAVEMFQKLDVPVLGVVENMSFGICDCGRRSYPFGRGGGSALAERVEVPLLAEILLDPVIMEGGDQGTPPVLQDAGGSIPTAFQAVAGAITDTLGLAVDVHHEIQDPPRTKVSA